MSETKGPDPGSQRRTFQGGAGVRSVPPAEQPTYGDMRYADGHGPYDDVKLPAGIGSGLSGMPQAEAGVVPPLWAEEDSAPATSRYKPRRPQA